MICPECGHHILVKPGLTPRQQECRDFIDTYTREHRSAPSYDDICQGLGLGSKSQVAWLVKGLEERGAVVRLPYRQRSLRVVD